MFKSADGHLQSNLVAVIIFEVFVSESCFYACNICALIVFAPFTDEIVYYPPGRTSGTKQKIFSLQLLYASKASYPKSHYLLRESEMTHTLASVRQRIQCYYFMHSKIRFLHENERNKTATSEELSLLAIPCK